MTKILIVDDEPNLLRMLGFAFHKEGYEVVVAQTGFEALSKVDTETPDLLILDVMMPDMNGMEVCQQIRAMDAHKNLPIIMLSARSQVADKVEGLRSGADEYLTKPVEIEEMLARVYALLERTARLSSATPQSLLGRVIGLIGAKGGAGTTTVTLNLAYALSIQGHKSIAAELHSFYGSFSAQLGFEPGDTLSAISMLEPDYITSREVNRAVTGMGMGVLFGPQPDDGIIKFRAEQARAVVHELSGMADLTLLDLPASPHATTETAVRLCDYICLMVEPDLMSLDAGSVKIKLLNDWGKSNAQIGLIVVNKGNSAVNINNARITELLKCNIFGVVPPMAEACITAQQARQTVVQLQPTLMASQNLTQMATRLAAERITPLQV
jgi:CheY-like chemotaxis protein